MTREWQAVLASWVPTLALLGCAPSPPPPAFDQQAVIVSPTAEMKRWFSLDALPTHLAKVCPAEAFSGNLPTFFSTPHQTPERYGAHPIGYGVEGEIDERILSSDRDRLVRACDESPPAPHAGNLAASLYRLYRLPSVSETRWNAMTPAQRADLHLALHTPWVDLVKLHHTTSVAEQEMLSRLQDSLEPAAGGRIELKLQRPIETLQQLQHMQQIWRKMFDAYVGIQYHASFRITKPFDDDLIDALVTFYANSNEFTFVALTAWGAFQKQPEEHLQSMLDDSSVLPASMMQFVSVTQTLQAHASGRVPWEQENWIRNLRMLPSANHALGAESISTKTNAVGFRNGIYVSAAGVPETDRFGWELRAFGGAGQDEVALWYMANATCFLLQLGQGRDAPLKLGPLGAPYTVKDASVLAYMRDIQRHNDVPASELPPWQRLGAPMREDQTPPTVGLTGNDEDDEIIRSFNLISQIPLLRYEQRGDFATVPSAPLVQARQRFFDAATLEFGDVVQLGPLTTAICRAHVTWAQTSQLALYL